MFVIILMFELYLKIKFVILMNVLFMIMMMNGKLILKKNYYNVI